MPNHIVSPDGRYRFVEENDPRIDERLRPRLRLEEVSTGTILFDAHSTWLEKPPEFRPAGSIWLELNHAGERINVLIDPDRRIFQSGPHDHGRSLDDLTGFLSEMRIYPVTYATTGEIVRGVLWLLGMLAFAGLSLFVWFRGRWKPDEWWKLTAFTLFWFLGVWACWADLRRLLRLPRRRRW